MISKLWQIQGSHSCNSSWRRDPSLEMTDWGSCSWTRFSRDWANWVMRKWAHSPPHFYQLVPSLLTPCPVPMAVGSASLHCFYHLSAALAVVGTIDQGWPWCPFKLEFACVQILREQETGALPTLINLDLSSIRHCSSTLFFPEFSPQVFSHAMYSLAYFACSCASNFHFSAELF